MNKQRILKQTTRLAVCLILLLVAACGEKPPKDAPEFELGQKVKAVISGDVGQIVWRKCCYDSITSGWRYDVRFPVNQSRTNTKLFSDDGAISTYPLALVEYMRAYELEPISN